VKNTVKTVNEREIIKRVLVLYQNAKKTAIESANDKYVLFCGDEALYLEIAQTYQKAIDIINAELDRLPITDLSGKEAGQ
jgi:hypothetical protein